VVLDGLVQLLPVFFEGLKAFEGVFCLVPHPGNGVLLGLVVGPEVIGNDAQLFLDEQDALVGL
jgi:hypothetical protein